MSMRNQLAASLLVVALSASDPVAAASADAGTAATAVPASCLAEEAAAEQGEEAKVKAKVEATRATLETPPEHLPPESRLWRSVADDAAEKGQVQEKEFKKEQEKSTQQGKGGGPPAGFQSFTFGEMRSNIEKAMGSLNRDEIKAKAMAMGQRVGGAIKGKKAPVGGAGNKVDPITGLPIFRK